MEQIHENIAENIIKLRKAHGLTQQDLASKLNYSDKAVSKWERGESIPDIEMLCKISEIFNVDIKYLTVKHEDSELKAIQNGSNLFIRNLLILIMFCVSAFFLSTVVFVSATIRNADNAKVFWVSYIYALPLCSLFAYIYAKKGNYWLMRLITISSLLWTLIASVYLSLLAIGYTSIWLLFLFGVPIQAAICLFFFWKKTF